MEALCVGNTIIDADIKQKARDWMPDEMRFAAVEQPTSARASPEIDNAADEDQLGDDQIGDGDVPTSIDNLQETDTEFADAA